MTLEDILFEQYLLGRDHEAMAHEGKKREVGGEITKAKGLITMLLNEAFAKGFTKGVAVGYEAAIKDMKEAENEKAVDE